MLCPNCSNQIPDIAAFCPECGAQVLGGATQAQAPYGIADQNTPAVQNAPGYAQPTPSAEELGMKWFKFIIYFQLFASALLGVANGIMLISGAEYTAQGVDPSLAYSLFPGLHAIDIAFGIVYIVVAVAAIFVRMQLAAYKANGPKLYLGYLGVNLVAYLAYAAAVSIVFGGSAFDSSTASQVVSSGVLIAINVVYFKKRAHLFTN